MNVLRTHHIGIRPGLSMFARGVLTIEGVMRQHCPGVSFVEIFTRSIQLNMQKDFNWRMELDRLKQEGYVFFKKTMRLPEQLSDMDDYEDMVEHEDPAFLAEFLDLDELTGSDAGDANTD
jgi:ubiquinone biosynthesis protein